MSSILLQPIQPPGLFIGVVTVNGVRMRAYYQNDHLPQNAVDTEKARTLLQLDLKVHQLFYKQQMNPTEIDRQGVHCQDKFLKSDFSLNSPDLSPIMAEVQAMAPTLKPNDTASSLFDLFEQALYQKVPITHERLMPPNFEQAHQVAEKAAIKPITHDQLTPPHFEQAHQVAEKAALKGSTPINPIAHDQLTPPHFEQAHHVAEKAAVNPIAHDQLAPPHFEQAHHVAAMEHPSPITAGQIHLQPLAPTTKANPDIESLRKNLRLFKEIKYRMKNQGKQQTNEFTEKEIELTMKRLRDDAATKGQKDGTPCPVDRYLELTLFFMESYVGALSRKSPK